MCARAAPYGLESSASTRRRAKSTGDARGRLLRWTSSAHLASSTLRTYTRASIRRRLAGEVNGLLANASDAPRRWDAPVAGARGSVRHEAAVGPREWRPRTIRRMRPKSSRLCRSYSSVSASVSCPAMRYRRWMSVESLACIARSATTILPHEPGNPIAPIDGRQFARSSAIQKGTPS